MKEYNFIQHNNQITFNYRPSDALYGGMNKPHVHDSYEIYYLLDGERYYFIHDKTYHIKKGMVVLVKPSVIHRTVEAPNPSHERLLLIINKPFLEKFVSGFEPYDWFRGFEISGSILIPDINQQSTLREAMFRANRSLSSKSHMNRAMVSVMEILLLINDIAECSNTEQYNNSASVHILHNKMSEVAAYINNNYMEHLSLESIAERFYFSTYYLSRNFKRITGFGLNEYINNVRILESEKLLQSTNMQIGEIAQRTGFDSQSHYGRVFKAGKGITPTGYRKRIQQIL